MEYMSPHTSPEHLIPHRVREERMRRGLTLDQLATQAGVSRAMISKIERGESSPTAVLLSRIGDAMGLSMSALMREPRSAPTAIQRVQEQQQWTDPATGYVRRLLSPPGDAAEVEIVAVELPPGQTVSFAASATLHSDDQILLLEGQLTLTSGATVYELQPGDCARVSTHEEQSFGNGGTAAARYLVIKRHFR